jgi:hypothetical protein
VAEWFATRVPASWFDAAPVVRIDRDEILVIGELGAPAAPETGSEPTDGVDTDHDVACATQIASFREATRPERMAIADEAEVLWDRKISWGVRCDGHQLLFTTQSVPVMTRLRMDERSVVDTLIAAGVARSRSEALAWCVRLVGQHQSEWIDQLRDAMANVDRVRADGPNP